MPAARPWDHSDPAPAAPSDDVSDLALVARMQAGDEQALGMLYDRWAARVFALALRVLGDGDDADEVVEETFWQAWCHAMEYRNDRGQVGTWLLLMARSRALDRLRAGARRRTRVRTGGEQMAVLQQDSQGQGDSDVEAAERREMVRLALSTLPREQRDVLELAFFAGLSQSEIAERTAAPLGTVKTRVRLAMQRMREQLSVLREGGR